MASHDEYFTALSQLPKHIASFTVNMEDGSLVDSTENITLRHATIAQKLFQNVNLFLEKQMEAPNNKRGTNSKSGGTASETIIGEKSSEGGEEPELIPKKVTVTFHEYNYGFTVFNDKIYAVSRPNTTRASYTRETKRSQHIKEQIRDHGQTLEKTKIQSNRHRRNAYHPVEKPNL
ncbi:hypothetical protein G9A89_013856 [Geosiphon pyriformis]|nr:hypothetical protein G9A89_013856 [Geosiphon pyriformis]